MVRSDMHETESLCRPPLPEIDEWRAERQLTSNAWEARLVAGLRARIARVGVDQRSAR